jgi:flagellar hook-length control protein FliK
LGELSKNAKLVLDGGKSEITMSLKPESLGKVALKIATENGAVSARFVVDGDEARRALEASLSELKETLQKQGLSVQECQVEVRRDGASPEGRGESGSGTPRRNGGDASGYGADGGAAYDGDRAAAMRDRYLYAGSSVTYTA